MAKLLSNVVIERAHHADGGLTTKYYIEAEELSHNRFMLIRREFETMFGMVCGRRAHIAYDQTNINPASILRPSSQPKTAGIFSLEEAVIIILNFNAAAEEAAKKEPHVFFSDVKSVRVHPPITQNGIHVTRPEQAREIRGEPEAVLNPFG